MVDTNSDPKPIDFVIPANDDATKSIDLIVGLMCNAIKEGLSERKAGKEKTAEKTAETPTTEAPVLEAKAAEVVAEKAVEKK